MYFGYLGINLVNARYRYEECGSIELKRQRPLMESIQVIRMNCIVYGCIYRGGIVDVYLCLLIEMRIAIARRKCPLSLLIERENALHGGTL